MFDIPGFDLASMSDEELLKKQDMIGARMVFANRFSNSGEMLIQLQRMNDAINSERLGRMQKKIAMDAFSRGPVIVDTDPDPNAPDPDKISKKTVQVRTPSMRRTKKPTEND